MLRELNLYPAQLRAYRAQRREVLLASEPRSGGSHALRVMALLKAVSTRGATIAIASPDERTARETHLDGPSGFWALLQGLPEGAVEWGAGGLIRINRGTIHVTTWEGIGRHPLDLLLLDDADELGLPAYNRLRERVLRTPGKGGPRIVTVSRRPDQGWIREHWRGLGEHGERVDLPSSGLPVALRGDRPEPSRVSFGDWIDQVFPNFPWYRHTELLVEQLQRVVDGEIYRLMIEAPPRLFKSLVVSRLLPAHFLSVRPHEWVSVVSATLELAKIMSGDARQFYRAAGGVFRDDSQDKSMWRTLRGGGMWARGVGGWILGVGFNLGIFDDPFSKWEEAVKLSVQEAVWRYFWNDYYTRRELSGERPAAIIVMQQRLAERDLLGRLQERERKADEPSEDWTIISLPAIRRPRREPFPPSLRVIPDWRENGEALCPELQEQSTPDLERLEQINKLLFAAAYQQEPFPDAGGGLFERWWWPWACLEERWRPVLQRHGGNVTAALAELVQARIIPVLIREGRGWDIGATMGGDGCASCRGGVTALREIVFTDAFEKHVNASEVYSLILETAHRDGHGVEVILPKEPAGAGTILIDQWQTSLEAEGFRVVVVSTSGSKYVRAMPHAGAARPSVHGAMGRCSLMPGEWAVNFRERHHNFDGVTKPLDLVDATAYLFSELDLSSFLTGGGIR